MFLSTEIVKCPNRARLVDCFLDVISDSMECLSSGVYIKLKDFLAMEYDQGVLIDTKGVLRISHKEDIVLYSFVYARNKNIVLQVTHLSVIVSTPFPTTFKIVETMFEFVKQLPLHSSKDRDKERDKDKSWDPSLFVTKG